jgi:hypothetical protein
MHFHISTDVALSSGNNETDRLTVNHQVQPSDYTALCLLGTYMFSVKHHAFRQSQIHFRDRKSHTFQKPLSPPNIHILVQYPRPLPNLIVNNGYVGENYFDIDPVVDHTHSDRVATVLNFLSQSVPSKGLS